MRVLEVDNNFGARFLITQNIDYFTIRNRNGYIRCFAFSDVPVKFKYNNKTRILYKDAKLNYNNEEINITDSVEYISNKTLNWIGIYVEGNNIFCRNPLYTGQISFSEVISKLQGK